MSYIVLPDGTVSKIVSNDEQGNSIALPEIISDLRETVNGYGK